GQRHAGAVVLRVQELLREGQCWLRLGDLDGAHRDHPDPDCGVPAPAIRRRAREVDLMASPRLTAELRRRRWLGRGAVTVLAILLLLTLAPFLVVAINAVKAPSDYAEHGPIALPRALDLTSIIEFWHRVDFTCKLRNSVVVSVAVAVIGVALSVMNAYALGI